MGKRRSWYLFIILIAIYMAIVFLIPIDPAALARYHITEGQARLLNITVVIPMIGIWVVAFYGFSRVSSYARAVRDTHEGPPFRALAAGLMVSVLGLPLASVVGAVFNRYAVVYPDALPTVTIMRNYFGVMLAVLAFYLIGNGAEALAKLVKGKRPRLGHPAWTVSFILCSSLFTWLITARPEGTAVGSSAYHLPDWLIVATIAVPYLYVWYRGAVAVYCIYFYQKNTKGTLYRRALNSFSAGIAVVIGASVFIQFLTTFSERVNRLNLTPVLLLIYLLLIFWAVGYGLIARGAKKLKTLEDV